MSATANLQRNAIIGTTLLVLLLAFLTTPPSEETLTRLSPEAVSPGGGAAVSRAVEGLGLGGGVVRMPWLSWCDQHPGEVLAVLAPTTSIEPESIDALLEWVEEGGTLVYVPGVAMLTSGRTDVALSKALGLSPRTAARVPGDREAPRITRSADGTAPLRDRALVDAPQQWKDWLRVAVVDEEVAGAPLEVWAADPKDRPAVALFERGEGRVLLWGDASSLRNDRLEEDTSGATFLRSLAVLADGRPVAVDGYAHGLAALGDLELALWRWSTGTSLGNATLLALAVGLLAMVVAGVRSAPPIPEPPPPGRSPLEHVDALADAYRRAGAHARPTRQLLAAAERRLGSVDLATRLASLRRMRPDLASDLDRVQRASEDPDSAVAPPQLAALCDSIDRLVDAKLDASPTPPRKRTARV